MGGNAVPSALRTGSATRKPHLEGGDKGRKKGVSELVP